jgi:hypothetical protein
MEAATGHDSVRYGTHRSCFGTRANFMFDSSHSQPISSSKGLSLLASRIMCMLNRREGESLVMEVDAGAGIGKNKF